MAELPEDPFTMGFSPEQNFVIYGGVTDNSFTMGFSPDTTTNNSRYQLTSFMAELSSDSFTLNN
jgi:hypothetical protein